MENYNEMLTAANEFGLDTKYLVDEQNWQRVRTISKPNCKNGAYLILPDGKGIILWDWQSGMTKVWRPNHYRSSQQEKFLLQQSLANYRNQQEQKQFTAAKQAQKLYELSKKVTTHAYCKTKHIVVPEAVRIYRGNLIVPLIDIKTNADQIMNVQTIQPNGRKQFLKGAKVTGLCFPIGLINNNLNTLYIAEGFATAMTFHLVTEELVLSAMNAGNLMAVALSARKRWPQTRIIIVGDDDWLTEQETGINPGVTKATAAATAVDGFTCFPPFSADQHQRKLTDWNDYLFDRIQEPA